MNCGKRLMLVAVALLSLRPFVATAAQIDLVVRDVGGRPLGEAVVYAIPKGGIAPSGAGSAAVVDQINRQFVPRLSVVQTGTAVQFPNKDNIRHHVYSFSPAKVFELKLYHGTPASPVVFDKPGMVVLGCNIHDGMVAYVYVVDSPYYGVSDAGGRAQLKDLPAGDYTLYALHYQMREGSAPAMQALTLNGTAPVSANLQIGLAATGPIAPPLEKE